MIPQRPAADGRRTIALVASRLAIGTPGTDRMLQRIGTFEAAGWATHAVLIRADPALADTVASLRAARLLPEGTAVHHFAMRDRRIRPAWWAHRDPEDPEPVTIRIGDWLDWLTGRIPGTVLLTDEPAAHVYVAAMANPLVARVADLSVGPDGPRADPAVPDPDADLPPEQSARVSPGTLRALHLLVGADGHLADQVRAEHGSPGPVMAQPPQTAQEWVPLLAAAADAVCDHSTASILVESLETTRRILRFSGVLADSASDPTAWTCQPPVLRTPAAWFVGPSAIAAGASGSPGTPAATGTSTTAAEADPGQADADEDADDPPEDDDPEDDVEVDDDDPTHEGDPTPVGAPPQGPTREVSGEMRSNAVGYVALKTGTYQLEFSDGDTTIPMLASSLESRFLASKIGNAVLERRADGTVWVRALEGVHYAHVHDGRLQIRIEGGAASDITHAVSFGADVDWADLTPTSGGARFSGRLRAKRIAPAEDSLPAICITDVAGYSRPVGVLHYTGEPTIEGLSWSRPVTGVLETDPLVATTGLAGGALALHVGFRGMLRPVGGLWMHGHQSRMHLSCPRGSVTLLPSPGGRVLVAPGRGLRVRSSAAARRALRRG